MHCRRLHEHVVEAGRVELGQVQADELRVRVVGGVMWLAGALAVESRLWLGGVVSMRRDRDLICALLLCRVRACGLVRAVLLCTDGLASYPKNRRSTSSGNLFAPARWAVRGSSYRRGS